MKSVTAVDESWRNRAACRDMDSEIFFPITEQRGPLRSDARQRIREAIYICVECPVRRECFAHATYYDEKTGIWGGAIFDSHYRRTVIG